MQSTSVFVDVLNQCLAMGDLRHAVAAGVMTPEDVCGDLAQLTFDDA
jgi:ornithine cyclodeaminase/alanine dehydrogenase-like protein (mu-crystallin family)